MAENHTPQKVGPPKYYTKGEAAIFLGYSVRTIDNWMVRRWLVFVRQPNGRVLFREEDLLKARDKQWTENLNPTPKQDPSMG